MDPLDELVLEIERRENEAKVKPQPKTRMSKPKPIFHMRGNGKLFKGKEKKRGLGLILNDEPHTRKLLPPSASPPPLEHMDDLVGQPIVRYFPAPLSKRESIPLAPLPPPVVTKPVRSLADVTKDLVW